MSSTIQLGLEGLVADILSEHFGEGVELVGVALLRHGPLSFSELLRVANVSFLAFPRDTVNPYTILDGCADSVGTRAVRDALLVLIHFDLVEEDPSDALKFKIKISNILRRLNMAGFLDLFEDEAEQAVVELVLKRGRVAMRSFSKEQKHVVQNLIGAGVLRTVDSVASNSPRKTSPSKRTSHSGDIVVTANIPQLELMFRKKKIIEYVRSVLMDEVCVEVMHLLLSVCTASKAATVSIGELALTDIVKSMPANQSSQQHIVAALIKLQGINFVRKQQMSGFAPTASATDTGTSAPPPKKRGRAVNNKQLVDAASSNDMLIDFAGLNSNVACTYSVRLGEVIEAVQLEILSGLVRSKYAESGHRILQLLLQSGQKLEATHIADICAISREETLKYLHMFSQDNICIAQEVPKISAGAGASGAGGLSAVMRAVASSFWLYQIDMGKIKGSVISLLIQTLINLRRRFRLEVIRQCKIEDRAAVLTEAQELYLQRVHDAQDTLEASSINLVTSLVFLML